MKLTDELFEKGKNQQSICEIIDDDYVILKKRMPCIDAELDDYINAIKKAKNNGINVCSITDYRLIDGTTNNYTREGKPISYTCGVFIEDRAKGTSLPFFRRTVKDSEELKEYFSISDMYISEIEKRANADKKIFNKIFNDYIGFDNYGLTPDPKPTNFFFDEDNGYQIIDVIDIKRKSNEYLSNYIATIIFGYGLPQFYDNQNECKTVLTESMYNRYKKSYNKIFDKMIESTVSLGLYDQYTVSNMTEAKANFYPKVTIIKDDELVKYIENYNRGNKR